MLKPSIEWFKNGESVANISKKLEVSENTIRRYLNKNGIVLKYSKPKQTYPKAMEMFLNQEENFTTFCKNNGISRK